MNRQVSLDFTIALPCAPNALITEMLVGGPMQFSDCDFSGLDLRLVAFDGCVFDQGCKFQKTRIGSCKSTKFYSCNLDRADFRQANITDAYALNCTANRIDIAGATISLNCNFFSGLMVSKADAWRMLRWALLPNSPVQKHLIDQIPPEFEALLDAQFVRDASQAI